MFNLVKYRFWFLGISLLIIVPGFISLLINGLNLSTDFTGGSRITVRPQNNSMNAAQVEKAVKKLNLKSLLIQTATDSTRASSSDVWIRLNTQVDTNVDQALQTALNAKYPDSTLQYKTTRINDTIPYVIYQVSGFSQTSAPNADDIKAALANLPKTGPANSTPTATPQPTATPAATATPESTATPTTTATPEPTATPTPSVLAPPANTTDVKVEDVQVGTTTQTIEITTNTQIDISDSGNKTHVTFPQIQQALLSQNPHYYLAVVNSSQVGAAVANQTTRNAILAVIIASVFILLYIWFSFRKVPKAIRYAASAIIALLHDVLVVLGVFSILGKFLGIQIDGLFITALLTVVGFSVHDTIVVFDRVRENMQRRTSESFEEVVNASLIQTMARSLNTSLTVLFTLLTLTLFTTDSVHNFTLALLIGIFSGTYSSIFNASMILVIWDNGELGFNHLGGGKQGTGPSRRERLREMRKRELAETR